MHRAVAIALLLLVAACAAPAQREVRAASACEVNETSHECQVERYNKVNQ